MMEGLEKEKRAGIFEILPDKYLHGEITFDGSRTSLYLHDRDYFGIQRCSGEFVKGALHDLTKISLIECNVPSVSGTAGRYGESYHFAEIFPHFVILGDQHIDPSDNNIKDVHLLLDDATTLFHDFDAFGTVIDARPFIDQIVQANQLPREVATGSDPHILYFTGKREIFSADTVLGNVSARHIPYGNFGGPEGIYLKNAIYLILSFGEAIDFHQVISRILVPLQFLEIVVGRPQNILEFRVGMQSPEQSPVSLEVYWSMPPKRRQLHERPKIHPGDVILDAVGQPDTFANVLSHWLDKHDDWRDARARFSNCFGKQRRYDVDRLIGAANMFDLLPSSAVPDGVALSDDLREAKDQCRGIFQNLPQSPERDSVLSALGRVGTSTLKRKIRHRARIIIDAAGARFADLEAVTDEAVNCRNHYVHGSPQSFDYNEHPAIFFFLANTLEFVFAASDLIDAGWNIEEWIKNRARVSHPFGEYLVGYDANLRELKSLLGTEHKSHSSAD